MAEQGAVPTAEPPSRCPQHLPRAACRPQVLASEHKCTCPRVGSELLPQLCSTWREGSTPQSREAGGEHVQRALCGEVFQGALPGAQLRQGEQ